MVINARKAISVILLLILVAAGIFGVKYSIAYFNRQIYPQKYSEFVEKYAGEYEVDKNMVYAIIKTESDFHPDATSKVGARGLMQIMSDTFDWIQSKIKNDGATFDDMYDPEENIRHGTFFISYLYKEFGSYETAIAAYHAGRGAIGKWLKDERYSKDGKTLYNIPIDDTGHYVNKVMKNYEMYRKLYE